MLKAFMARLRQGYRTGTFPDTPPVLPDRFAGRPEVFPEKVSEEARKVCPVEAVSENGNVADVTVTDTAETPFEAKMEEEQNLSENGEE